MTPRIRTDLAQVVQRPPQSPRPTRVARRRMLIGLSALAFVSGCADDGVSSERLREVRLVTYDAYVLPDGPMPSPASKVVLLPSGDAGAMLTKASLNKERPAGDVMFGVDTSLLTRAIDADLFAPLDESVRDLVPDEYRSLGGDSLVPIDVGQVCINADTRWFAEQKLALPQSFDDLILPSYKDLLVVENPAVSSPGLMFLAATVSAIGPSWSEWWQALKENGVKVAADWSEAYEREYTVRRRSHGGRPPRRSGRVRGGARRRGEPCRSHGADQTHVVDRVPSGDTSVELCLPDRLQNADPAGVRALCRASC